MPHISMTKSRSKHFVKNLDHFQNMYFLRCRQRSKILMKLIINREAKQNKKMQLKISSCNVFDAWLLQPFIYKIFKNTLLNLWACKTDLILNIYFITAILNVEKSIYKNYLNVCSANCYNRSDIIVYFKYIYELSTNLACLRYIIGKQTNVNWYKAMSYLNS